MRALKVYFAIKLLLLVVSIVMALMFIVVLLSSCTTVPKHEPTSDHWVWHASTYY